MRLSNALDIFFRWPHLNYHRDDIDNKKKEVLKRWEQLKEALIEKRSKLGESQTLQQFSRDADEIENWMMEKLQLVDDGSGLMDSTNIQVSNNKPITSTTYIYRLPTISKHCPSICEISSHLSSTTVCCYCCGKRMLHANFSEWIYYIWISKYMSEGYIMYLKMALSWAFLQWVVYWIYGIH